jgi:hypothetical protein
MNDITRRVMANIAAKSGDAAAPSADAAQTGRASGEAMDRQARMLHDALAGDYAKRGGGCPADGAADARRERAAGRVMSLDELAGRKQ